MGLWVVALLITTVLALGSPAVAAQQLAATDPPAARSASPAASSTAHQAALHRLARPTRAMPLNASVQGRVVGLRARPLGGATLAALDARNPAIVLSSTATRSDGTYALKVPGGLSVKVRASIATPTGPAARFWVTSSSFESAAPLKVDAARAMPGVDFSFDVDPARKPLVPRAPLGLSALAMDPAPYQPQTACSPTDKPGTTALAGLIRLTYGSAIPIGTSRPCTRGSSEHSDGRAVDWMVNARVPAQAQLGDDFVFWLSQKGADGVPGAMARRLGVMYVIWRGKMWRSYAPERGWTDYLRCTVDSARALPAWDNTCHRTHVHISMNRAGANLETSWWLALEANGAD